MNNKATILTDDKGNVSSIRIMSFIALVASLAFGGITIQLNSEQGLFITFGFLLAAFAPKALQKFAETSVK